MVGSSRTLPLPRAVAGPLRRLTAELGRRGGLPTVGNAAAAAARSWGLEPLGAGLLDAPEGPGLVLLVQPSPPERRADFLTRGARPLRRALPGGLLVLNPTEFGLWRATIARDRPPRPSWGELPPGPPEDAEIPRRRAGLRRAAGLLLDRLPEATARFRRRPSLRPELLSVTGGLRRELEARGGAARFPPIPAADAPLREHLAAAVGVAHAAFAPVHLQEDGPALPDGPEAPPRSADATRRLLAPLLADLPDLPDRTSLVLAPGPWGRRHAWRLVAVVPDDAPLHEAAALWERLLAHLGLVDCRGLRGAFLPVPAPCVLTRSTLRALLDGRLFAAPLERLSWRLHRDVLRGEDPTDGAFRGLDCSDDDLRAEAAAACVSAARLHDPGRRAAELDDLLFGTWPALLGFLADRDPRAPLHRAHAALARRTDPALARVGFEATRASFGDPHAVDLGRAAPRLRAWGPALVRLQEVAAESLG